MRSILLILFCVGLNAQISFDKSNCCPEITAGADTSINVECDNLSLILTKQAIGVPCAKAKIAADGSILYQDTNTPLQITSVSVSNGSSNNNGPGNRYTATLSGAHPNGANYTVQVQPFGELTTAVPNGAIDHVTATTANNFEYLFHSGDDGQGLDENDPIAHFIEVCGCVDSIITDIQVNCVPVAPPCETFADITANRPLANTGWNNEFNTSGQLHSGDIELCFTVDACANNSPQMIGLNSDIGTNASYTSIDYAMYVYKRPGNNMYRIYVYENGAFRGLFVNQTTPYTGSEFCVRRVGTAVTYWKDGSLIYSSTVPSTADLGMDNSFYYQNGFWGSGQITIGNLEICPFNGNARLGRALPLLNDDGEADPEKLK